jgi:hypothetical protein
MAPRLHAVELVMTAEEIERSEAIGPSRPEPAHRVESGKRLGVHHQTVVGCSPFESGTSAAAGDGTSQADGLTARCRSGAPCGGATHGLAALLACNGCD